MTSDTQLRPSVVLSVRGRTCAIGAEHVVETMRPLPIEPMQGMPSFVLGLAAVRGAPVPVVDIGRLLGCVEERATTRFVTLRIQERRVALAVEAVVGVHRLDPATLETATPLLGEISGDLVETMGRLDGRLLLVLQTARLVSEDVWRAIDAAAGVS